MEDFSKVGVGEIFVVVGRRGKHRGSARERVTDDGWFEISRFGGRSHRSRIFDVMSRSGERIGVVTIELVEEVG